MNTAVSRRVFLGAMTAAAAMRVQGANDRIRLGVIGTGGRGRYLMGNAIKAGNVQVVALCDAYDVQMEKAQALVGTTVDKYSDYRKVLERKDVDAVIVATWDNTHCPITVAACRAGKDVFIEKPMTLHPMEGHPIVKAVRETKRIVQVGTQQRSMPHFIEAKERFIDSGLIGRVNMVRTIWNGNGAYRNQPPPPDMEKKPAGLDWAACLEGLPQIPWDPKRYFNHYVYWDFSTNAQVGGLFVHTVDVVHWYLKIERPLAAVAMGGIYLSDGGRDTPDNVKAILQYPEQVNVTFEATVTDMIRKESADIIFMGTEGRLSIFRYGYKFLPADDKKGVGEQSGGTSPDLHVANWLDCIRSRKQPNVDAVAGHYSAMACHIANMAYRQKTRVVWKEEWNV